MTKDTDMPDVIHAYEFHAWNEQGGRKHPDQALPVKYHRDDRVQKLVEA